MDDREAGSSPVIVPMPAEINHPPRHGAKPQTGLLARAPVGSGVKKGSCIYRTLGTLRRGPALAGYRRRAQYARAKITRLP